MVLTKADQAPTEDASAVDAARAALELAAQGVPVRRGQRQGSRQRRRARTLAAAGPAASVLVGSSGAGKSTLTNTLLGIERMKTGEVRESDSRGRHTTTHRALIPLPSGACLIDTPGMRELKPTGEEDVAENFGDIEALAEQCRFRDCEHATRARLRGARGDRGRHARRRSASPTTSSCATRSPAPRTSSPRA